MVLRQEVAKEKAGERREGWPVLDPTLWARSEAKGNQGNSWKNKGGLPSSPLSGTSPGQGHPSLNTMEKDNQVS